MPGENVEIPIVLHASEVGHQELHLLLVHREVCWFFYY